MYGIEETGNCEDGESYGSQRITFMMWVVLCECS